MVYVGTRMETLSGESVISADHLEIVEKEFAAARLALEPTSRNTLAIHLSRKAGIPLKSAEIVVDQFIENTGHAIPDYLGKEFVVGWWKVIAIAFVIVGLIFLWWGRELHLQHKAPYAVWCLGALLCGSAVFFWIKSLEKEVENARTDFDPLSKTAILPSDEKREESVSI